MARRHHENLEYVWRTIITSTYANGATHTSYAGPFKARNHATAAGTREMREGATSYVVQCSKLEWEDVLRKDKNEH